MLKSPMLSAEAVWRCFFVHGNQYWLQLQSYMSYADIPILVVDDAKFSSTVISKTLSKGGFNNVRFTNNPLQALRSLEKRHADIVITNQELPSMDGLEFSRKIRLLDDEAAHRTHIMLLAIEDSYHQIEEQLEAGVDEILQKINLRAELLPRVLSALRITERHNTLLEKNIALERQVADLIATDVIDPGTGLGNLKFTIARGDDLINQVESRGGAAAVLLVGINNLDTVRDQYDNQVVDELMSGFGLKVKNLVRPLDIVTRPEHHILAVSMLQPSLDNCTSQSFRRIFDNLYMHSFKTSEGFIPVVVGVSICAADESTGLPESVDLLRGAYEALLRSYETGIITVSKYSAENAEAHRDLWAADEPTKG